MLTLELNSSNIYLQQARRRNKNMLISVKMARVGAGLTQAQTAEKMGIHPHTYMKLENDPESMTIKDAKLFGEIVGIDWEQIFFGNDSN